MIPGDRKDGTLSFFTLHTKQLFGTIHEEKPRGVLDLDAFLDVDALEKAEAQIDQFIEKRAREKADEQKIADLWAESDRRDRERRREENRRAWLDYERHLEGVHMGLAADHRAKAEALEEAV